jgi:hypothetical protein
VDERAIRGRPVRGCWAILTRFQQEKTAPRGISERCKVSFNPSNARAFYRGFALMARAGRRRKAIRERWRPPPPDKGSPQLQTLRSALVGQNDLELTPLGALRARNLVSREAHDAGTLYGALTALARVAWDLDTGSLGPHYRRVVANGFGLLSDSPGVWAGDSSSLDERCERARARLAHMDRALLWPLGRPSLVSMITRDIVIDQRWDEWIKHYILERPEPQDKSALVALVEGLRRLCEA